ncbi:MAG: NAD(P)-dependent methylenetetrahydromethanopterin dehydrogenase [Planctomycetota bacterium]
MPKRILLQLDVDSQPSTFDSVVAIDAGAEHLLRHGNVDSDNVIGLIHGAMFTRGGDDLAHTAVFIGGSHVGAAEAVYQAVKNAFFGPVRVSVMLDAAGCNTTAAAAVVSAERHLDLSSGRATVLGATGPVGRRVAQMLARRGAEVVLCSRQQSRAEAARDDVRVAIPGSNVHAAAPTDRVAMSDLLETIDVLFACGAAGVQLVDRDILENSSRLKVAIDLNAVPPAGLEGVEPFNKAQPIREDGNLLTYGPIGVGGLKMKTHRKAIAMLFESNDATLDADEIDAIATRLEATR